MDNYRFSLEGQRRGEGEGGEVGMWGKKRERERGEGERGGGIVLKYAMSLDSGEFRLIPCYSFHGDAKT